MEHNTHRSSISRRAGFTWILACALAITFAFSKFFGSEPFFENQWTVSQFDLDVGICGTQGSEATVMISDIGLCLVCQSPDLQGYVDEFSESEEDVEEDVPDGAWADEVMLDVPQDDTSDDLPGIGHTVEEASDESSAAQTQNSFDVPPQASWYGYFSTAAVSLLVAAAARMIHGFGADPSATIRTW